MIPALRQCPRHQRRRALKGSLLFASWLCRRVLNMMLGRSLKTQLPENLSSVLWNDNQSIKKAHSLGQRSQFVYWNDNLFSIGPSEGYTIDLLAHFPASHTLSKLLNHSREFSARDERKFWLDLLQRRSGGVGKWEGCEREEARISNNSVALPGICLGPSEYHRNWLLHTVRSQVPCLGPLQAPLLGTPFNATLR